VGHTILNDNLILPAVAIVTATVFRRLGQNLALFLRKLGVPCTALDLDALMQIGDAMVVEGTNEQLDRAHRYPVHG
jgi:hypothetical protein